MTPDQPARDIAPRCPEHDSPLPPACPKCLDTMARPVETMTLDERADEIQHWIDVRVLTVDFSTFHKRHEELVGRPVWTHEFATPENLVREARSGEHPADLEAHVIGSLDQLAGNKPVLIVKPDHG